MFYSRSHILAIGAAASLSLFAGAAHAQGTVVGSVTTVPSTTSIDLTAQGTTDWANFAYGNGGATNGAVGVGATPINAANPNGTGTGDHKAGGSGIGVYTFTGPTVSATTYPNLGINVFGNYGGGDQPERTWSDGTAGTGLHTVGNGGANTNPEPGGDYGLNGSRYGISGINYTTGYGDGSGVGSGYSFSVAATALPQVFTLYVAASHATGVMTASLSDGTGLTFTDTNVTASGPFVNYAYSFLYSDATPGTTLNVNWMETARLNTYDTVGIEAATLAAAPEPSSVASLALGVLGLGGLALVARRRSCKQSV